MKYDEESAELLSTTDIANILGKTKKEVYKLLSETGEEGKIKAYKYHGKWKCTKAALNNFMKKL